MPQISLLFYLYLLSWFFSTSFIADNPGSLNLNVSSLPKLLSLVQCSPTCSRFLHISPCCLCYLHIEIDVCCGWTVKLPPGVPSWVWRLGFQLVVSCREVGELLRSRAWLQVVSGWGAWLTALCFLTWGELRKLCHKPPRPCRPLHHSFPIKTAYIS